MTNRNINTQQIISQVEECFSQETTLLGFEGINRLFILSSKLGSIQVKKGLSGKLKYTLQVFLSENLHYLRCAEALEIHRHTLTYRLSNIKEHTGLDPSCFKDAVKLQLALMMDYTTEDYK